MHAEPFGPVDTIVVVDTDRRAAGRDERLQRRAGGLAGLRRHRRRPASSPWTCRRSRWASTSRAHAVTGTSRSAAGARPGRARSSAATCWCRRSPWAATAAALRQLPRLQQLPHHLSRDGRGPLLTLAAHKGPSSGPRARCRERALPVRPGDDSERDGEGEQAAVALRRSGPAQPAQRPQHRGVCRPARAAPAPRTRTGRRAGPAGAAAPSRAHAAASRPDQQRHLGLVALAEQVRHGDHRLGVAVGAGGAGEQGQPPARLQQPTQAGRLRRRRPAQVTPLPAARRAAPRAAPPRRTGRPRRPAVRSPPRRRAAPG